MGGCGEGCGEQNEAAGRPGLGSTRLLPMLFHILILSFSIKCHIADEYYILYSITPRCKVRVDSTKQELHPDMVFYIRCDWTHALLGQ